MSKLDTFIIGLAIFIGVVNLIISFLIIVTDLLNFYMFNEKIDPKNYHSIIIDTLLLVALLILKSHYI